VSEGLPALVALLIVMEAGVPIPVPSDLLILVLGERTSAGRFPLLLVVVALELVAAVGTAVLFFAVRGPGRALLSGVGPRLGLTAERLARATGLLERRGMGALLVGRATPGLRTVTVVAAGTSTVDPARALPPLILGSSVFVQLHLFLGYFLGPAARDALDRAKGPTVVVLLGLAAGGAVAWIRRRGARKGLQSTGEACCPACLALGALTPKLFGLEPLA
jgi:membrane protein DedA with SNARE-associated domain